MKRIITYLVVIIVIIGFFLLMNILRNNSDDENNLTKVTLAEVAHSVFYAPQYVAISEGFFEEEGININLTLTSGADAVMAAVLSGDVDVGFCGTEATIYVYTLVKKKVNIYFKKYIIFKRKK